MATERKYCSICAWRRDCQKRFSVSADLSGNVRCPDFTRDVSIKDQEIDEKEKEWHEK